MHTSVLLQEATEGLGLKEGMTVVDATVGNAGHSKRICEAIGKEGRLVAIDRDVDALTLAREKLMSSPCKKIFVEGNFRDLADILKTHGISAIDALLLDLGLRTEQLERSGRGFSLRSDEPLLMTFRKVPQEGELTAYEIVNSGSKDELQRIIKEYGEESFARKIAKKIVEKRKRGVIGTTGELVALLEEAIPRQAKYGGGHFATKTFQALRIAVNDELSALEDILEQAPLLLKTNGKIAVISFHSLEDRIVKQNFKKQKDAQVYHLITKKPIVPNENEKERNSKSRSAKLRIAEKI